MNTDNNSTIIILHNYEIVHKINLPQGLTNLGEICSGIIKACVRHVEGMMSCMQYKTLKATLSVN